MYYILGLILFIILMLIWISKEKYDDSIPSFLILISGVLLFIAILAIPLNRVDAYNLISKRDALQSSYNNARKNPLEMATVAHDIADYNAELATAKYWRNTQWFLYFPKEIMNVKPIE